MVSGPGVNDGFAAFLAVRPAQEVSSSPKLGDERTSRRSSKGELALSASKQVDAELAELLEKSGAIRLPSPTPTPKPSRPRTPLDAFSAFQSMRPPLPQKKEQGLNEEQLRAKLQLLDSALQAEDLKQDSDRKTKARAYLRHPEWAMVAISPATTPSQAGSELEAPTETLRASETLEDLLGFMGRPRATTAPAHTTFCPRPLTGTSSTATPGPGISTKFSMSLPPIGSTMRSVLSTSALTPKQAPQPSRFEEAFIPCKGWFNESTSWNVVVSRSGASSAPTRVRRQSQMLPGGSVVFGNGCLPLYTAFSVTRKGYFYSFSIDAIDEDGAAASGMTLGFGVSRLPPDSERCEKIQYAYEIPGTALVGFGNGRMVDLGKWRRIRSMWDPKKLKKDDVVGVLVSLDGDFMVYVNDQQVLRIRCSLEFQGKHEETVHTVGISEKRRLYPVIDISGRVSAVTLLPYAKPPDVAVQPRDELLPEDVPKDLKTIATRGNSKLEIRRRNLTILDTDASYAAERMLQRAGSKLSRAASKTSRAGSKESRAGSKVEPDPMQRFASERPATVGAVIAEDPGEEEVAGEEEVTILEGGPGEEHFPPELPGPDGGPGEGQASPEEGSPENAQEEN